MIGRTARWVSWIGLAGSLFLGSCLAFASPGGVGTPARGWGPPGAHGMLPPGMQGRSTMAGPAQPWWQTANGERAPVYRWRPLRTAVPVPPPRAVVPGNAPRWSAVAYQPYRSAGRSPVRAGWATSRSVPLPPFAAPARAQAAQRRAGAASQPPGWWGAGRPTVVTLGGNAYRFRPLPPPRHHRLAVLAPLPQWQGWPAPAVARWPSPQGEVVAAHAAPQMPAGLPSFRQGWQPTGNRPVPGRVVYRFRPDPRFSRGEVGYVPTSWGGQAAGHAVEHGASAWPAREIATATVYN